MKRYDTKYGPVILLATVVAVSLYLAWSWAGGNVGFPLDDAWIHQTYARNLVETGQWAFVPGQPSSGSTAPLWTLLLALGYLLGLPYRLWAYTLGGLCLLGTAGLAMRLAGKLWQDNSMSKSRIQNQKEDRQLSVWLLGLGFSVVCEWHLVWAAVSGMETLLFAMLSLAVWERVIGNPRGKPFLTGLLGGALILTRPEGVIVVGLAGLGLFLAAGVATGELSLRHRWLLALSSGGLMALGTFLVVTPFLALNVWMSGTLWPNTFYAKQAEYAAHLAQPLWERVLGRIGSRGEVIPGVGTVIFIGGQILLLPGLIFWMWRSVRPKEPESLAHRVLCWLPLIWVAATILIYTLRLPVIYQHGRYLIPVIPIILIYGVGGMHKIASSKSNIPKPRRLFGFGMLHLAFPVLLWSTVILFLVFVFTGAQAYAADVAIIEGEMVAVAHWLNDHTEPEALIAVHDIGAVGYFSERRLLDLAGLVNPEIVPFIRNEEALLDWLEEQEADYLATFPSWYPRLVADPRLRAVYSTGTAITVDQGGDNMVIYESAWDQGP